MLIKRTVKVNVPGGFYCSGCAALRADEHSLIYSYHCDVNGEDLYVREDKKVVKCDECLKDLAKSLRYGGFRDYVRQKSKK